MKKLAKYTLLGLAALALLPACKEDEKFDTQVTREMNLTLNGEPYINKTEDSHVYGDWNVYIYKPDGDLKGNYKTQYRFALESGEYRIFSLYSTTVLNFFEPATNLNDVTIKQDPDAVTNFAVSDIVDYKAGDVLNVNMVTRTGLLRLRSADEKADKSYAKVRATIKTPIVAYRPVDSSVITCADSMEIVRVKEVPGGGVGYAEDLQLIGSDKHDVRIIIDYLDAEDNVLNSKAFAENICVAHHDTTTVSFMLNNPEEKVILNYTVELGSTKWDNSTQYPAVPVDVPDGYTYVEPGQNIDQVFNALKNDDNVDEIRLFLKASTAYKLSEATTQGVAKPISIVGQTPGYGQQQASLTITNMTFAGDLKELRFENLNLLTGTRFFNIRNQVFNVEEIAFVGCTMDSWSGILFNQVAGNDNEQNIGTFRIEDCRLINYTAQSNPFINLTTTKLAPIAKFIFTGNVFHGKNYGTRTVLLSKLTKMKNPIEIVVENNTFIDTKGTEYVYFDIDAKAASSCKLTVKDNIVSGTKSSGTWFKLGKTSSIEASGNTRTAGFTMKYGIEEPAEVATTYSDLLKSLNL